MSEERFSLFRLCECPTCGGHGKVTANLGPETRKCLDCRGEGRIRQELAACATPQAVGVALVTLAREGEWTDADGNPCAFGLLDREGEKGKKWLVLPWTQYTPRHVTEAARTLARSKTPREIALTEVEEGN